jgi:hypothetical protein
VPEDFFGYMDAEVVEKKVQRSVSAAVSDLINKKKA